MKGVVAILSGVAVSVATAIPLAYFGKGLEGYHGGIAIAALALGFCAAVLAWLEMPADSQEGVRPPSFWDWVMIGVFACASARVFFWLIYADGDSWKILSPNNLGDLSLHLAFIQWMEATPHWWPASPILAGDPLRYPPGSDLFNSLLLVVGVPVVQGLLWCALGGAALTGYALWRWGRGIALAALLFSGGLAVGVLLQGGNPDEVCEWKNLFLTLFVTQRGFLFVLPAGLLLLCAWRDENFGKERRFILPLPIQALLLAATPLFSIHAALYLGVAMVGVALAVPEGRVRFAKLALMSWPLMAFFGWLVTSGAGGPSAIHSLGWKPGWMSDGTVMFWFRTFGISLPLGVLLTILLFRRGGSREARAFVWPAAFVFMSCMFIRFAPWEWDNTKLMLWSWIVMIPYFWSELIVGFPFAVRVVTLLLLFGSGAVTLKAGLDGRNGYELIKRDALNETAWILKDIPPEAVIACAPEYNHPVIVLGHPVVCGYEGHLWSHGLDYQPRLAKLNDMMNGESDWRQKAAELGVNFIYWGPLESAKWPDSKLPWAKENTGPSLHQVGSQK